MNNELFEIIMWTKKAAAAADILFDSNAPAEARREYITRFMNQMLPFQRISLTKEQLCILMATVSVSNPMSADPHGHNGHGFKNMAVQQSTALTVCDVTK